MREAEERFELRRNDNVSCKIALRWIDKTKLKQSSFFKKEDKF